jgi:uncharacterized membrane protein (DUF485 family)
MALSNMLREPRRELTEQAVGMVVLALALVPDYYAAVWLQAHDTSKDFVPVAIWMIAAALIVGVGVFVLGLVMYVIHQMGEGICDALARRGLELRPRERR